MYSRSQSRWLRYPWPILTPKTLPSLAFQKMVRFWRSQILIISSTGGLLSVVCQTPKASALSEGERGCPLRNADHHISNSVV